MKMFTVVASPRKLSLLATLLLVFGLSAAQAQTRYSTPIVNLPGYTLTWTLNNIQGHCGTTGTFTYQQLDFDNPDVIYQGKTTPLKIGVLASYITDQEWPVQACPTPGAYNGSFSLNGGTVTVVPTASGAATATWSK